MENIAPQRALTRRSRAYIQLGFIVLAIGAFFAIVGLLLTTILLVPPAHPQFGLYSFAGNAVLFIGVLVFLFGLVLIVRGFTRRRENDLAMLTGEALNQTGYFDGRYSFIRNLNPPGAAYIDAVLVGPPGALVFRIVDFQGTFATEASNWVKQNRQGDWVPFSPNLTKQTVDDVQHLRQFLAKKQLGEIPVYGVIVFTGNEQTAQVLPKEPVVPVAYLHTLVDTLAGNYLLNQERIPQQAVTAVRRLLLDE